jgi:hypothetical protein
MPIVTQSNPGSENYGITNGHTMLCQWHNPALQGSLQHHWMRSKKNIMPEIMWSQMQHRFMPGFEMLLDHGVTSGWYDTNNTLQLCVWFVLVVCPYMDTNLEFKFRMIFHWAFIPWLQWELDAYQDQVNNTRKWWDRNKILSHGAPNIIYQSPENFGILDFKVSNTICACSLVFLLFFGQIKVKCEALDHVHELYINPSHVVFNLVPQPFSEFMEYCYTELRQPLVTWDTTWDIYLHLLAIVNVNDEMIQHHIELLYEAEEELTTLPLIENPQELPYSKDGNGGYYMGGVGGGLGLGMSVLFLMQIQGD